MERRRKSTLSRKKLTEFENNEGESSRLDELCFSLIEGSSEWNQQPEMLSSSYVSPDPTPPFECFATQIKGYDAKLKLVRDLQVGDELCVRVKRVELAGVYVQPLCVLSPFRRCLGWIEDFQVLIGRDIRDNGLERPNDLLRVLVIRSQEPDDLRFELSETSARLSESDLPLYFRNSVALHNQENFDCYIRKNYSLSNANLSELLAFKVESFTSFLPGLREKTGLLESRASHLRKRQNEELSMQSVVKGVEKVRAGEYTPAVQHFFKALEIYDRNIEALVGRAAAYANMGKYDLAENDLDAALSIRNDHSNAKTYMVEVLIKAANELMEMKEIDEAKKKYEKILKFKNDKRALDSLKEIKRSSEDEMVMNKKRRLSNDELRRKSREMAKKREQRRSDAKKLAEMERFIAQLKNQTDA